MDNNNNNQPQKSSGCLPSILGFFVGFWVLGPLGGIIGAALGSYFGGSYSRKDTGFSVIILIAYPFSSSLLVLSAAVMKADGTVKKSELDYVKQFFLSNFGQEQAEKYILTLREILKQDIQIADVSQ